MSDQVKRGGFRPAPPTTLPSAPPPPPIGLVCRPACCSRAEAARLGRILAALREPSDKMVVTVFTAIFTRNLATKDVIRAAVAAAEQEVGRE